MQGLLQVTSDSVSRALEGRLWPGQFTVVLPTSWRQNKCGVEFKTPKGQTRYKVSSSVKEKNDKARSQVQGYPSMESERAECQKAG